MAIRGRCIASVARFGTFDPNKPDRLKLNSIASPEGVLRVPKELLTLSRMRNVASFPSRPCGTASGNGDRTMMPNRQRLISQMEIVSSAKAALCECRQDFDKEHARLQQIFTTEFGKLTMVITMLDDKPI